jgi:hypothetical protein
MDDEAWPGELGERDDSVADDRAWADDPIPWADAPSPAETAASFCDQMQRGIWPIRVAMALEIYAEGSRPQVHPFEPGRRRHPESHIITLVLEYDRARVCEMLLDEIRRPRDPRESVLLDLVGLAPLDRNCFLNTAAEHFAKLLGDTDEALRRDRYLFGFVRELHEFDGEVIGELVAATMRVDQAAGIRLRDVILELVDDPEAREHLGWLAAAAITDQLEEL